MANGILVAGVLPPPACYPSEQARYNAYIAATTVVITGGLQWTKTTTAAAADKTLYWLQTDNGGETGRPIEPLNWSTGDGVFYRWLSSLGNTGTSGGAVNAYALTFTPTMTAAESYALGRLFVFKATTTNTGPCTLNVDGQGAIPILKLNGVPLAANDIYQNQMVVVICDGAGNFWLQSTPATLSIQPQTVYATSPLSALSVTNQDLSLSLPAGTTTWKSVRMYAVANVDTNAGDIESVSVTFKWNCGVLLNTAVNPTYIGASLGNGNSGDLFTVGGQAFDTCPWNYDGQVPVAINTQATLILRATFSISGAFDGVGWRFWAEAVCQ
jgi:hypothetical protein